MARRLWGLGVLACAALALVLWSQRPTGCAIPIAYHLGHVDERFGLTGDEVQAALLEAEAVWQRAVGRGLFSLSPRATLTVNLVYDERQQSTQIGQRLVQSMRDTRASHAAAGRTHDHWRLTYEARARDYDATRAAYDERARAYNADAQHWNVRGGAPPEAQAALEAERSRLEAMGRQLDTDRLSLQELAATVRSLADKGNAIAHAHNREVVTFNERYGSSRRFHKGEFDGRDITVFEFHDVRDLTLVLVHELGHALGLGHVDDPAAIMHPVVGSQVVDPLDLTPADVAAFRALCSRR